MNECDDAPVGETLLLPVRYATPGSSGDWESGMHLARVSGNSTGEPMSGKGGRNVLSALKFIRKRQRCF